MHGSFGTLEDADAAAQRVARSLDEPIERQVGVAILDREGNEVGGYWSGDGGSF